MDLTELRRPEPLDLERHDRSEFDSGETVLDQWLRHYTGETRRRDTAATWVIADRAWRVVAYASIALTGVERPRALASDATGGQNPVPALLLGRRAVDRRYAGLGIGTALVAHVLATAVELNAMAACHAVVVPALTAGTRDWWEGLGFRALDGPDSLDLYLLSAEIEATLRS